MIANSDILKIKRETSADWPATSPLLERDFVFALLSNLFDDVDLAVRVTGVSFHGGMAAKEAIEQPRMKTLRGKIAKLVEKKVLDARADGEISISKEENRAELVRMIGIIEKKMDMGQIEQKDGLKMIADIRVKLNDKFEIEQSSTERRIIVVPQKRGLICKYTQRECTYWPTKEACMKHYKLKSIEAEDEEDKGADSSGVAD